MAGRHAVQQRLQQRVMGATQDQNVGVMETVTESLGKIDASDLLGDRVLDPTLFDKGHEQRARFLVRAQAAGFESLAVSVAAYGGFGSDDHNFLVGGCGSSGLGSWFDYAYHGHMSGRGDAIQRQRRCGVAGNHEEFRTVGFEIVRGLDGVACDGLNRFGAVGKSRRISEVEIIGGRDEFK